jgi:hypothetical protein
MFSPSTQTKTILHPAIGILFIAMAFMTHAGTMEAQKVNWVSAGPPSPRNGMGMAYDEATHATLLFGGSNFVADTWIWQGGWLQLSPAASPSPRTGSAMAYDGAAGNIVLFGGQSSTSAVLGDTWTWDGKNWTQQFPAVSPPARNNMALAYDAATYNVVLFGGGSEPGGDGVLGDTWIWDGLAKTWAPRRPASSPPARSGCAVAYDAATNTVVLFGGTTQWGSGAFGDTWSWNGSTWSQQFPASAPSARSSAGMTYDPGLGALVLFGGAVNGMWQESTNDTWEWNGINWTEIYPASVPPNRYNFGMDYDPGFKIVLMFGGFSTGPARNDTWLLALAP